MKTYKGLIYNLGPKDVFVFGSNVDGRHGAGTARIAADKFGAVYGVAKGHTGQCYALPTTDLKVEKRPSVSQLFVIDQMIDFYNYASLNPDLNFLVAYTTKGPFLSGFTLEELVEMFAVASTMRGGLPENVVFEEKFAKLVEQEIPTLQ